MKKASIFILWAFLCNAIGPLPLGRAEEFVLPVPGTMVALSPGFNPPILKGLKVYPDNPFRFDFILDQGTHSLPGSEWVESNRLIKYFLASLTVPEKDLWVNLSPYEKNRIVPQSFGQTEMGRDLLAEDYMLKQITASLIYPEDETGKKFWKRIYAEAAQRFGTTNIPVNTFNKVWIVPDKAVVYENAKAGAAYIVEAKLKVVLEEDHLSTSKHLGQPNKPLNVNSLGSSITRAIVLPELTKEVNEGKNFAQLRQVYHSLILAAWYKKKIKDSILSQVYADKNKIQGLVIPATRLPGGQEAGIQDVEIIYQRYLQAFKKGVYNYIKEEFDPVTRQSVLRKYFSGGEDMTRLSDLTMSIVHHDPGQLVLSRPLLVTADFAMVSEEKEAKETQKGLFELVDKADQPFKAKEELIKDLKGKYLVTTFSDGWAKLNMQGYLFHRKLVDKGRFKVVIQDIKINEHGRYEIVFSFEADPRFAFQGETPLPKVFEIGDFKKEIYLRKKTQDKPISKTIFDIIPQNEIGLIILKNIISNPDDFNAQEAASQLNSTQGYVLGEVYGGKISFSFTDGFQHGWPVFESKAVHQAFLKEARVNKDGFCELTLSLFKNGVFEERTFEIGRFLRKILQISKEKSEQKEDEEREFKAILRIVPRDDVARRVISTAISKDHTLIRPGGFEISEKYFLNKILFNGKISITPIRRHQSYIFQLRTEEEGLDLYILKGGVNERGFFEYDMGFYKNGRFLYNRVFEIGRFTTALEPTDGKGEPKEVFEIKDTEETGNRIFSNILFEGIGASAERIAQKLMDIQGYPVTQTNSRGQGNFTVQSFNHTPYFGPVEFGWQLGIGDVKAINNKVKVEFIYSKHNRTSMKRNFVITGTKAKARTEGGGTREVLAIKSTSPFLGGDARNVEGLVGLMYDQPLFLNSMNTGFIRDIEYLTKLKFQFKADKNGDVSLQGTNHRQVVFRGLLPQEPYKVITFWRNHYGLFLYFISKSGKVYCFDSTKVGEDRQGEDVFSLVFDDIPTNISAKEMARQINGKVSLFNEDVWEFTNDPFKSVVDGNSGRTTGLLLEKRLNPGQEIPLWFNVHDMKIREQRLKEIWMKGRDFLSPKTKRFLYDYPNMLLDPEIFAEIMALMDGMKNHKQGLLIRNVPVKNIVSEFDAVSLLSTLLDRRLVQMAGLNPEEMKSFQEVYPSPKSFNRIGKMGDRDMENRFHLDMYRKAVVENLPIRVIDQRVSVAAWQWMYYDSLYTGNLNLDFMTIKPQEVYWGVYPYQHMMEKGSKELERPDEKNYYLSENLIKNIRSFMPSTLVQDGHIMNGYMARKLRPFVQTRIPVSQWLVDQVYAALSAAARQGNGQLQEKANAIWQAIRNQLIHNGVVANAAMTTQQRLEDVLNQSPGGLNIPQAAGKMGIKENTLRKWVTRNKFTHEKLNKKSVVMRESEDVQQDVADIEAELKKGIPMTQQQLAENTGKEFEQVRYAVRITPRLRQEYPNLVIREAEERIPEAVLAERRQLKELLDKGKHTPRELADSIPMDFKKVWNHIENVPDLHNHFNLIIKPQGASLDFAAKFVSRPRKIPEIIRLLRRVQFKGRDLFSEVQADRMARAKKLQDRLVFLKKILGYTRKDGLVFSMVQAYLMAIYYKPGTEAKVYKRIEWLMAQEARQGQPLFTGRDIAIILLYKKNFDVIKESIRKGNKAVTLFINRSVVLVDMFGKIDIVMERARIVGEAIKKAIAGQTRVSNDMEILARVFQQVSSGHWKIWINTVAVDPKSFNGQMARELEGIDIIFLRNGDKAMKARPKGGIDFTAAQMKLHSNVSSGIKFHIDPAQLIQLQNVPGFTPVIISIRPMMDVRAFLGLPKIVQNSLIS